MNHLDLCSGIGGWALAFRELGINTIAFCEIDKYPQQVLQKNFPDIPIFNDLKELTYEDIKERTGVNGIDIVTCSYPCQPFSVAGKQKGEEDPRHLWTDTFRIVQECKPTWFVGENVSGHIKLGLDTVLEDLASEGYDTRTFVISASSVGAWHQRQRLWIVGHSKHNGQSAKKIRRKLQKNNQRGSKEESLPPWKFEGTSRPHSESLDNRSQTRSQSNFTREERGDVPKVQGRTNQNVSDTENRGREQTKSERGKSIRGRSDDRSWTKRERKNTKATDVSDTESLRSGRRSGEECRSPQWQFLQEEQEGCEIRGEVEGRSTSSGEDVSDTSSEGSQRHNAKSSIDESQLGQSTNHDDETGTVSDTSNSRLEEHGYSEAEDAFQFTTQENWWQTQSKLCGVPDGISYGLDKSRVGRIKGLGNAIVPQIAWFIGNAIVESSDNFE